MICSYLSCSPLFASPLLLPSDPPPPPLSPTPIHQNDRAKGGLAAGAGRFGVSLDRRAKPPRLYGMKEVLLDSEASVYKIVSRQQSESREESRSFLCSLFLSRLHPTSLPRSPAAARQGRG